jgi:hypothetical protein
MRWNFLRHFLADSYLKQSCTKHTRCSILCLTRARLYSAEWLNEKCINRSRQTQLLMAAACCHRLLLPRIRGGLGPGRPSARQPPRGQAEGNPPCSISLYQWFPSFSPHHFKIASGLGGLLHGVSAWLAVAMRRTTDDKEENKEVGTLCNLFLRYLGTSILLVYVV